MKIAVFPGTFDPIHWGHLDVLESAARLFDRVIWVIADNPSKNAMFTLDQRFNMMLEMINGRDMTNVTLDITGKLIVDVCNMWKAEYIVRSFRMAVDFDYEMQFAFANASLDWNISTVFFPTRQSHMHISSTLVRELIKRKRKADLYTCVPPALIDKGHLNVD